MPLSDSRERIVYSASLMTLSQSSLAAGCAALIAWFAPVRRPMDLVIPPVACVVYLGLLLVDVLQRVDEALYRAKGLGGNVVA